MTVCEKAPNASTMDLAAPQEVNTFSFRAVCASDLMAFIAAATQSGLQGVAVTRVVHDGTEPDVEAEVKAQASLEQMRDVIRSIDDGQVMLQTMRQCPLADNDMKLDLAVA